MKQAAVIIVHGSVQGVGFRYFVKQKADLLGITGFVKNQYDGSVYIEAEGEKDPIHEFINICKQGPYYARIDSADIQFHPLQGYVGFDKR